MPNPDTDADACPYVVGPTYSRKDRPTFEYKSGSPDHTGGGYPRVRSIEDGPEVSRAGMGDVFVSIHRLAAVVWCYDTDEPLGDVCDDLRERDVHHQLEMPSANLPGHIEVLDHAEHSKRTGADRTRQRAWFEDAKRDAERREQGRGDAETCDADRCDGEAAATFDGVAESFCLECATARADGRAIQVL